MAKLVEVDNGESLPAIVTPEVQKKAQAALPASSEYDPTSGMSTTDRFLAGVGKGMTDLYRGAKQIAGKMTPEEYDAIKKQDAALMNTTSGTVGNIVGQAAPFVALPMTGMLSAGAIGAGQGALAPVGTEDSRLLNTGIGAGAGMLGQGIANGVSKLLSGPTRNLTPTQQALAARGQELGFDLTPAQLTGNRVLRGIEGGFSDLPLTSGVEAARARGNQNVVNRLAANAIGASGDNVAPEVLTAAQKAAGQTIGDIAKRNTVNLDNTFVQKLIDAADEVANMPRSLPGRQRAMGLLNEYVDKAINNGVISGEEQQVARSVLRDASEKGLQNTTSVPQARAQKAVQKALDDAMYRSVSGGDAEALAAARAQYAASKAISEAKPVAGDVSGIALNRVLEKGSPGTNATGGTSALDRLRDAAAVSNAFKMDIPNSGTTSRSQVAKLLTDPFIYAGGLMGAGQGYNQAGPEGSAVGGGLGIAAGLLGPRAAQSAYFNPIMRYYLTHGLLGGNTVPAAATNAASRSAVPGLLNLINAQ